MTMECIHYIHLQGEETENQRVQMITRMSLSRAVLKWGF